MSVVAPPEPSVTIVVVRLRAPQCPHRTTVDAVLPAASVVRPVSAVVPPTAAPKIVAPEVLTVSACGPSTVELNVIAASRLSSAQGRGGIYAPSVTASL